MTHDRARTIPEGGFADLGGGLFAAVDADWSEDGRHPVALVADSRSEGPDAVYGADAWGGAAGPRSGLVLLLVEGTGWDEVAAYRSVEAPASPFPGRARVGLWGLTAGLGPLHGRTYADVGELAAALDALAARGPGEGCGLATFTASERAASPHGSGSPPRLPRIAVGAWTERAGA